MTKEINKKRLIWGFGAKDQASGIDSSDCITYPAISSTSSAQEDDSERVEIRGMIEGWLISRNKKLVARIEESMDQHRRGESKSIEEVISQLENEEI